MKYSVPAIVMNMDSNGLGIVRSLGRIGVEVYGIDYKVNSVAFSSKYCRRKTIMPNPIIEPRKLLDEMLKAGKEYKEKPVLFPTSDSYVIFISNFVEELSAYYNFNIPFKEVLTSIVDKNKQYQTAVRCGIPTAKTYYPETEDDLYSTHIQYPVFIKGRSSHQWFEKFKNKGFLATDEKELKKYYELAINNHISVIVQEIIAGPNSNHYKVCAYYSKNNKLLAIFSTQKTRQCPVDFGVGSYMRSGHYPELIELAKKYFEGINYNGVGSIEFKRDERDGIYRMIELNPRFWQQNIQATTAGVNFAKIYYLDCLGEKIEPEYEFKENVCWLDAIQDFQSFLGNYKNGHISFNKWIKSVLLANCYAYFSWDDLLPGMKNSRYWSKYLKLPYKILK